MRSVSCLNCRARLPSGLAILFLSFGPAAGAELRSTTAGPQYEASSLHTWFLGEGWRRLWTMPIQVPTLELEKVGGGLSPVKQVGGMQSKVLALKGADGLSYTFRALDKAPRILPPGFEDTMPARLVQDQTSASNPAATVIAESLAAAAGILHTSPRLVLMPDDPALGEFRSEFGGLLGTIDLYPTEASNGQLGFHGATEIVSTVDLWDKWMQGPENRVDSRAFLRARLFDLFLNDWDRHRDQWRWARLPGHPGLQPIPEDHDQAFSDYGGLLLRGASYKLNPFRGAIPRIGAITYNGADLDRWLLADLERKDFREVAAELQASLGNDVIRAALREMPREYYETVGASMERTLEKRRDGLAEAVERYYLHLAGEVDVHGTDRAETATLRRFDDGSVELSVALIGTDGVAAEPYYDRRFDPEETREVRVYLHGGDDRLVAIGRATGPIRLYAIGGPGADRLDDTGGAEVRFLEVEDQDSVVEEAGTQVERLVYVNPAPLEGSPWREPRNWGKAWSVGPSLSWDRDELLSIGAGVTNTDYGFRRFPFAFQHTLSFTYVTGRQAFRLDYEGEFRRRNPKLYGGVETSFSTSEQMNFFGFGNESPRVQDDEFYRADQNELRVYPALIYEPRSRLRLRIGPLLRYLASDTEQDNQLNEVDPYGVGRFGQFGLRLALDLDRRNRTPRVIPGTATQDDKGGDQMPFWAGYRVQSYAELYPALWDVDSAFGAVGGSVAAYVPFGQRLSLAGRVGGRLVLGTYPWHDSAFLGGGDTLRSYSLQRYAGDGSVYGNFEARVNLGSVTLLVPGHLGLFALTDVGRVFFEGEDSNQWHAAGGGGVFFSVLNLRSVFHVAIAGGSDGTGVYADYGFSF